MGAHRNSEPSRVNQSNKSASSPELKDQPSNVNSSPKLKQRRNSTGKVSHIKLPSQEVYASNVTFCPLNPRLQNRLKLLMKSDQVKLMDRKYFETLYKNLRLQEGNSFEERCRARKKLDNERFRQLVMDGVLEVPEEMEELNNHPIVRVNKVFKHLDQINLKMKTEELELPPLTPQDVFEDDLTGSFFRKYPAHQRLKKPRQTDSNNRSNYYDHVSEEEIDTIKKPDDISDHVSQMEIYSCDEKDTDEYVYLSERMHSYEDSRDNEWAGESGDQIDAEIPVSEPMELGSVTGNRIYCVAKQEEFNKYKPHRSRLVDQVFKDSLESDELYELAEGILGAYSRELDSAQDFYMKLSRYLN